SGRRAPHLPPREEPIHALPEAEFLVKLRELNGTPEEVLQHEELMKLLTPILRADFTVHETYEYVPEDPLEAGISAFGGLADPDVLRDDLEAWKQHTRGKFRLRMLPGDHFFINSSKDLLLESLARDLSEISATALPGPR
ncbi:MAG TPA: thioesterase domain-containing protein, partial [Thermoanaerobaculia bacterium]